MKILFNGCSHTYGVELEHPETQRYSALLGHDHVNLAQGGKCNDLIVKETIEWLENNTCDFVIVQFTLVTRFSHWENGKWRSYQPKNATLTNRVPRYYYKWISSNQLHYTNFWKNVFVMESYLKKRNIPHYFWRFANKRGDELEKCVYEDLTSWSDMLQHQDLLGHPKNGGKYWLDSHPSPLGHQLIADHLTKVLDFSKTV